MILVMENSFQEFNTKTFLNTTTRTKVVDIFCKHNIIMFRSSLVKKFLILVYLCYEMMHVIALHFK